VPSFWTKINRLGINLSEVAFVNWNAGGDNSVSGLGNVQIERNYKFRYIKWDNFIRLRYGLNAQEGRELRKTDDAFRLSSTFGYRRDTISNWYYSAKANFNTQFSNGYKYPDRTTPVSRFMAPGYFFLGAGTSYISENQKLNLYISPLTQKATFVLDQELADKGAFGVKKALLNSSGEVLTPGENSFIELGFLITNRWNAEIAKNVSLSHDLSLYSDYLSSFGNVDIDWELNFNLVVNKFINTSIGTHLIYDDDILFDRVVDANGLVIEPGEPRIQFKQLLGVGITYEF
jgi:acetyltransferase-like isoleucine patch superfamily enzyme